LIPWKPLPEIAGTYSGRILVCGGARCIWDDLADFLPEIRGGVHVMCINDLGMHYPYSFKHWYSNSADELKVWSQARRRDLDNGHTLHSCNPGAGHLWPWPGHGTSGLNAVYTALALGYDDIILCGIPLDDSGHYFDPPWRGSNFTHEVPEMKWWKNAVQYFDGKVSSRSGRTRELLNGD